MAPVVCTQPPTHPHVTTPYSPRPLPGPSPPHTHTCRYIVMTMRAVITQLPQKMAEASRTWKAALGDRACATRPPAAGSAMGGGGGGAAPSRRRPTCLAGSAPVLPAGCLQLHHRGPAWPSQTDPTQHATASVTQSTNQPVNQAL